MPAALLFFALVTSAPSDIPVAHPPMDAPVVARVGQQTISANELRKQLTVAATRPESVAAGDLELTAALDELIGRKRLLQAAIDAGYLEDAEVRRAIEGLLIQRYRSQVLDPEIAAISVSDQQIEAFYHQNLERYRVPAQRRAAVLQLEGTGPVAQALAQEAATQARSLDRPDFGPLAAEHSLDRATRYRGGDMGDLSPGIEYRWPADVVAAAFALTSVGEVSPPITAAGSTWLVRLSALGEARVRPLADVTPAIRYELVRRAQEQRLAELLQVLEVQIPAEINEAELEAIEVPARPTPPRLPADPDPTP